VKTAAIDIETTGTSPTDRITVVGIDVALGSRLFLNTGGRTYPEAATERIREDFDRAVTISVHDSERAQLDAFRGFVTERFSQRTDGDDEFKFAAYNGETWNGGFDLPFIRTRCRAHGTAWPLRGPYVDVMEVVSDRFNVSDGSLETTYRELVEDGLTTRDTAEDALPAPDSSENGLTARDPFEDSGEAVEHWREGAFEPLLRHNLADIRRTRALVRVAERYCSRSHFSMRSLDPVDPE